MKTITSYLKELTIVTIGVLIALFLSNLKENNEAIKYQMASTETIKNEVESNFSDLKIIIEKQTSLLDTLKTYKEDHISIIELFQKASGLQIATLSNVGLEFYKINQISTIDFEIMSSLIKMKSLSDLIDTKLEKFMDFILSNIFAESQKSKKMAIMHLLNVLESENQLLITYQIFIDRNMKSKNNTQ